MATTKKMTIKSLLAEHVSADIAAVLGKLNHGTFGDCHTAIFKETGVWVEDLVPVFQKLDALLAFRPSVQH
ncbi:MAG: hypothetical protein JWP35_2457 [Caulobacter sp.]|nr:hypothetical protein [Caulobacter sp.]